MLGTFALSTGARMPSSRRIAIWCTVRKTTSVPLPFVAFTLDRRTAERPPSTTTLWPVAFSNGSAACFFPLRAIAAAPDRDGDGGRLGCRGGGNKPGRCERRAPHAAPDTPASSFIDPDHGSLLIFRIDPKPTLAAAIQSQPAGNFQHSFGRRASCRITSIGRVRRRAASPAGASSKPANSKAGATVQPVRVHAPRDTALCQQPAGTTICGSAPSPVPSSRSVTAWPSEDSESRSGAPA